MQFIVYCCFLMHAKKIQHNIVITITITLFGPVKEWYLSSIAVRNKAKSVLKAVFVSFPHKGQHYVIVCYSKIKMFDSTHIHLAHHLAFNLSTNVHAGIGWSSSLGSAFAILAPHL